MSQAILRGIRRGLYLSATADTSRLRELREEAETTNYGALAWQRVGNHLSNAMQVETHSHKGNYSQ